MTSFPGAEYILAGIFAVFIAFTVLGALLAVGSMRVIRSVSGLAISCVGLAGLYYYLHSPFLALMEILIYIGAVCVTIVFAIMLAEPEESPVKELYGNPRHPYTLGLLGSLPRLDEERGRRLVSIEGLPPDLIALPQGCPFYARCDYRLEKCQTENPALEPVGPNHKVACWVDVGSAQPTR